MKHIANIVERSGQPSDDSLLLSISLNGQSCSNDARLPKPFSEAYIKDMRWYLESFITKDSFNLEKARWMKSYLTDIGEQLRLHVGLPVLNSLIEQTKSPKQHFDIEINVSQNREHDSQRIFNVYWELLEDPELWLPGRISVVVRRQISKPPSNLGTALADMRLASSGQNARAEINVLLVLARAHSKGSEDAQTHLAYQHLLAAKVHLESESNRRRIILHMVRPGSFPALKKHLEDSSALHGPGYYQIVHFDVHGRVAISKSGGAKQAFLCFASPSSSIGKLKEVPAKEVAGELVRHGIRIAVLNACESARSSSETDANLASVFVNAGVSDVLAMSYKLLESAATLLTKAFYRSFLIDGKSFSTSASEARKELRTHHLRTTRFRTSEPLLDWIIPVVYTGGQDVSLTAPGGTTIYTESLTTLPDSFELDIDDVVGRGGDILHLDRLIVEQSCTIVMGSPGIGKSALVDELCNLWRHTDSFDLVINIQVKEQNVRSRADLIERIATSLLVQKSALGIARVNLAALRKGSPTEKDAAVLSEMRTRRTILVLDGIRDGHHNLPIDGWPAYLAPAEVSELCGFVNDAMASPTDSQISVRVVLLTRHDLDSLWRSRLASSNSLAEYRVQSLSLANAFDLATNMFIKLDVPAPIWYEKNADALEQVLLLCDLNPLAIRHVVSALARNLQIGFDDLLMKSISLPFLIYTVSDERGYSEHQGTFDDLENGHFANGSFRQSGGNNFLFEMHKLWESFHPHLQLALCYLGLFWHSGPMFEDWMEKMMEWGICAEGDGLRKIVQIIGNRLWIESEDSQRVTYIHPILTMFLRDRLCDQQPVWSKESIGEQAFAVFWTFRCILMEEKPDTACQNSVFNAFLSSFSNRMILTVQDHIDKSRTSPTTGPPSSLYSELYNVLLICGLCTSENLQIPPHYWPREGLNIFLEYVTASENGVHYRRLCVDAVGRLLASLVDQYDLVMNDAGIVQFWMKCMSHFFHLYNKLPTFPEKVVGVLSTIPTFLGGLDAAIWDAFDQHQLVESGDVCHFAALLLSKNGAEDAHAIEEEAEKFYHRALQRVVEVSEDQDLDLMGRLHMSEPQMNLLLRFRALEWQDNLPTSTNTNSVNDELAALREDFSALRLPLVSPSSANDTDQISLLGSAYDESDVLSAAMHHQQLAARAWNPGQIQDAARHLDRVNELVKDDPEVKAKFPNLQQQRQTIATALKAQKLADSVETTAKASNYQSMRRNWAQAYALLGASPSETATDLQEAYMDMMETQRSCIYGASTMARLDPPQPQREMRARGRVADDPEDQIALDTAWLRSSAAAIRAVENKEYREAISCVETMEELQSSGMVTWHDASAMSGVKTWLEEEDNFAELSASASAAVAKGDLTAAQNLMNQCTELDGRLENRHQKAVEERWQALRSLQWNERLLQAKQLGENDHFAESLSIFAEIEAARDRHQTTNFFALRFENDLKLTKHQIMMRFAVKEARHVDAASAARTCVAILENTPSEELPSLSNPKMRLLQACAAIAERAMIWYHQAGLAVALETDHHEGAVEHLDALIHIGETEEAFHPPEWLQVREELDVLRSQRDSLRSE